MNVTFTLDDFRLNGTGINTTVPLITLYDNFGCLRLADADLNFSMNYTYITDPPILGDWGNFSFQIVNSSFTLNSSSTWNDTEDKMDLNITVFKFDQKLVNVTFDGLSDVSGMVTNIIN